MAPIVYTPTVGEACLAFSAIYSRPRGMYFTTADKGEMRTMVYNWPADEVDIAVVTDGGRILGLGDLGANGMGIPIGKCALYVAAGGIEPSRVLPIMLDLGTNNQELLNDPTYIGRRHPRPSGEAYYEYVDEFMSALRDRWPNITIQFEDFTPDRAQDVLERYRKSEACFNDDIQGTGATALGGLYASLRAAGQQPSELGNQRIVVVGAGSAGLGVATSIVHGMIH